jgi:hypothetical protein
VVLNDGGNQTAGLFKIQIHRGDNKKPAVFAAGVLSVKARISFQPSARRKEVA